MRLLRKIFERKMKPVKTSLIKELLRDPDGFNYNIEVNNGEIVIRIKKVEEVD